MGRTIYKDWHDEVEQCLSAGELRADSAPSNKLIHFNDRTWHQGTKAIANGWRFFIRASRYYDAQGNVIARHNARTNELRKQVQVYMPSPFDGW